MWSAFEDICTTENLTINQLCTKIDQRRNQTSLTTAIRVFILGYYRHTAGTPSRAEPIDSALFAVAGE